MKYHYMLYQETTDNRVSIICLNPVKTGKDCVNRGLFLTDNDLYNQLTHQNSKRYYCQMLLRMTENMMWQHILRFRNSGMSYCFSGRKKKKSLLVSNGITSYYFLSNQQVKWTIYGLVSLRVCITMLQ
jgi:hypothetical protein